LFFKLSYPFISRVGIVVNRAAAHSHRGPRDEFSASHLNVLQKVRGFLREGSQTRVLVLGLVYRSGRLATSILDVVLFQASVAHPLEGIFSLITLLPTLAVAIRRLHDVDRSGWWLLMYLTIIGIIYPLLVWKCTKGTEGNNRFGPDSIHPNAKTVDVFT
jgi:uncharacterized membrane protein YhaH (DUF805 family)